MIDPEKSKLAVQDGMYVRPETFRSQMQYLANHSNIIALDELVEKIINKQKISRKTIAITFDDGWVDNYENAFPILKEFKIPATIFLPTSFTNSSKLFWTDRFSVLALLFREQNAEVQFVSKNAEVERSLRKLFHVTSDFQPCLETSILKLKTLGPKEREEILNALEDFLQFDPQMLIPPQFLNWKQISEMEANNITFGSHGHKHLELGRHSAEEIAMEVDNSLTILKNKIKKPSSVFCYPEGSFSEISDNVLSKLGVKATVANKNVKLKLTSPPILGRIGIHQDMTSKLHMFKNRIWCNKLF